MSEEILIECDWCNGDGYIEDEEYPNEEAEDCPVCKGVACITITKETK
jgi:hypothetical protein